MAKFKEIKTQKIWDITNSEHLKHFRKNPRFEEIKEEKKVETRIKKEIVSIDKKKEATL